MVMLHAPAFFTHDAQVELRCGKALVGRSVIPLDRLGIVLSHALATLIHKTQLELRCGKALVGRSAIPFDRLGVVLLHTPAYMTPRLYIALSEP